MMNIAKKLSHKESETDSLTTLRYSALSKHSLMTGTPEAMRVWLTSLQPDSHVNRFHAPEKREPKEMTETCGLPLLILSELSNQNTFFWKTCQRSLPFLTSEQFSANFPKAGMMRNGYVWRLATLGLATSETGCGYWPTPVLKDSRNNAGSPPNRQGGQSLGYAVKMFPTPTVNDSKQNAPPSQLKRNTIPLNTIVKFPTPTTERLCGGSGAGKSLIRLKNKGHISESECRSMRSGNSGKLNPDWVEWLMGWPIGWTKTDPLESLVWYDISIDPHPKVERLTEKCKDRTKRIKGLGNGQVPQCYNAAFRMLIDL